MGFTLGSKNEMILTSPCSSEVSEVLGLYLLQITPAGSSVVVATVVDQLEEHRPSSTFFQLSSTTSAATFIAKISRLHQ